MTYIDGFNLYFGMKDLGWRRYYWLDICRLSMNLLKPTQQLVQAKYFTSRVSGTPSDPDKDRRQNTFLEAIQTLPNLAIFYGQYQIRNVGCRQCGARWPVSTEKMTDVNIATELLIDAFTDGYDTALLVSADSDLTGPVCAVRSHFPSKRVICVFPPNRNSETLKKCASGWLRLDRAILSRSQLPDQVTKPDGFVLRRPPQWK